MTFYQPLQTSFESAISDLVMPLLSSRTSPYIELPVQQLSQRYQSTKVQVPVNQLYG